MKKVSYIFILYLCLTSCIFDYAENRTIKIVNNSKTDFYCFYFDSNLDKFNLNEVEQLRPELIKKDSSIEIYSRAKWENYIEESYNKKLNVYIIEKDTLDKYDWEKIISNKKFKKQISKTLKELETNKWAIDVN